jgi:hypothetical protein
MSEKLDQIKALRVDRAARNSSRGGSMRGAPQTEPRSSRVGVPAQAVVPHAELVPGPRETKPKRKAKKAKAAKAPKVKIGRPRVEDRGKTLSDRKPWVKAKMSRATWYRRQMR